MSTLLAVREKGAQALVSSSPARDAAQYAGLTALLNCYIREFAQPQGEVCLASHGNIPQALSSKMLRGDIVLIMLHASQKLLAIKAERWSLLGRGHYGSAPFIKQFGKPWRVMTCREAISLLLTEMAAVVQQPVNQELMEQIENSIAVTQAFLECKPARPAMMGYIRSEQSLLWGHPMHPSPKSRSGVEHQALLACSPEVGARFALYWFKVDPAFWQLGGNAEVVDMLTSLAGEAHCYPCHPWEVTHIVNSPLYQRALSQGAITPLGERGVEFLPTSSVRTLYSEGLRWYLKCSIHVRLTNCVRKNAWYELESAVALSKRLATHFDKLEVQTPGFHIMREPAASSLDFSALAKPGEQQEIRYLQECFGILYRENLSPATLERYQPEMAAALFAFDRTGENHTRRLIGQLASQHQLPYHDACLRWLTHYLDRLVPGVLHAFFAEGIIFEPHLQNVLVGFENHLPTQIWVRDLEGTKLVSECWPESQLADMSARARQSVWYPREKGWNRVAYCLFINHLSEAIFHLSDGDRVLEQQLWDLLSAQLETWQQEPEVAAMLAGAPIPSKNNLRTRLLQRADKLADYTLMDHPIRSRQ
ncbi:IucA/IucC family protein [Brenneria uluponensis]|uniref:IucA/IucC family protein n=1 Tax=Brenneria uluponensis TaxID=3057057 RepID=UPI0028E9425E|nr:IucA/IucC family protein [Brenneria ulupoensis]